MLQQKIQKAREEDGFTLIELLVVILIIGILAAIALPTFLGQSDKAKDSAAKSDVRNAVSQIESYLADGPPAINTAGWLTTTNVPELAQFKLVTVDSSTAGGGFKITATSKATSGGAHTYSIQKSNSAPGGYTYTASTAATGAAAWAENGGGATPSQ